MLACRQIFSLANLRLAALVSVFAVLSQSCAPAINSSYAPLTDGSWQKHVAKVSSLAEWRMRGKVSMRLGEESFSVPFIWKYQDGLSQIYLLNFFGLTKARIEWTAAGVEYFTNSGESRRFISIAAFSRWQFGFSLPLAEIRYWVTGVPSPRFGTENIRFSATGGVASFTQNGWSVKYLARRGVDGLVLPAKALVERENARALFIISDWSDLTSAEEI